MLVALVVVATLVVSARAGGIGTDDVVWTLKWAGLTAAALTVVYVPVRDGRPIGPTAMAGLAAALVVLPVVWAVLLEALLLDAAVGDLVEIALVFLAPGLILAVAASLTWWWARRRRARTQAPA